MCDTVTNMITTIRNASKLCKQYVDLPFTKHSIAMIAVLKRSGFVWGYDVTTGDRPVVRIGLKYSAIGEPVIRSISSVSKPGNRVFVTVKQIPVVLQGLGIAVISTNRGLLTDREAKSYQVGGEYVCRVY